MREKGQQDGKSVGNPNKSERSHRYSEERGKRNAQSSSKRGEKTNGSKHVKPTGGNESQNGNKNGNKHEAKTNGKALDEKIASKDDDKVNDEKEEAETEEQSLENEQEKLEREKEQAMSTKATAEQHINDRIKTRERNLTATSCRPDETFFRQLDSSMKKNTSFIRKLKTLTEQQRTSLETEFAGINLSKYILEVVTAITEAKIKAADVNCAAYICSLLHQRYADFTPMLKQMLLATFNDIQCKDDEKIALVPKLRVSLRLLTELVLDGVFGDGNEGIILIHTHLTSIISSDKVAHVYAPAVLSFVRHCGEDLVGLVHRKYRLWKEKFDIEIPTLQVVPQSFQTMFSDLLCEYYNSMSKRLLREHKDLQNWEKQNKQIIGLKGDMSADRKEVFEKFRKSHEKLLSNTTALSEILDQNMPDLPDEEPEEKDDPTGVNLFTPSRFNEYDSETGLWEDEDTRTFYESLKDLQALVPHILFKEKESILPATNHKQHQKDKDKKKKKTKKLRQDLNFNDDFDDYSGDDFDDDYDPDVYDAEEDDTSNSGGNMSMASVIDAFLKKMPNCVNRDFVDQAAEEFIMKMNTKINRKKLHKALFTVSRTRLDLLPFYSRFVATLAPCLPDIGHDLVFSLKRDMYYHIKKKRQNNLETKIKSVRFIGELTKFKVCPKAEALHGIKILLEDFTHHNIEMACSLLETCGRFLYRSPESQPRMHQLLEQLMRRKQLQNNIDSRQATMIDNAFYYCNPPERSQYQVKTRPPMHEYIRKLIYKDLTKTTTERVLKQMRKLPWDDDVIKQYAIKCMTHIWNVKYNNIHCAANMLSGLSEYHDNVGVAVVDGLIELVRLGMEVNVARYNQKRISSVKYLGEIFNYQLIEGGVIMSILYSFITFACSTEGFISELDPPDHLFRIRLVCILLDTCGQYFDHGMDKKKLDCFLVFFQTYIWQKKSSGIWSESNPFPRELDYMISDTFEALRPKYDVPTTYEEAIDAQNKLSALYQSKIDSVLATVQEETSDDKTSQNQDIPSSTPPNNQYGGPESCSLPDSLCSGSPPPQSPSSSADEGCDGSDYDDDMIEERQEYYDGGNDEELFTMEDDMDDEVRFKDSLRKSSCPEDDIFRQAYDQIIAESFQNRLTEAMKPPAVDIAIPMHLQGKTSKPTNHADERDNVKFVLMTKKGNKQQFKDLVVPVDSNLAANMWDKQRQERAEHEEMKRLVLDYNKRQEEEAYNDMLASSQPKKQTTSHGGRSSHSRRVHHHRLRQRDTDEHHTSAGRHR